MLSLTLYTSAALLVQLVHAQRHWQECICPRLRHQVDQALRSTRRLLQRFIRSAAGERASDLRVSLSGGSLLLTNLELNLDSLLGHLPVQVERAYARQLRISVPWTALATQPIQAHRRSACPPAPPQPVHTTKLHFTRLSGVG